MWNCGRVGKMCLPVKVRPKTRSWLATNALGVIEFVTSHKVGSMLGNLEAASSSMANSRLRNEDEKGLYECGRRVASQESVD